MSKTKARGAEAHITRGAIVIRVPIRHLPVAVEAMPGMGCTFKGESRLYVTNAEVFAKELVRALNDESEDGTTRVHKMLDDATMEVMEQGGEGIEVRDEDDSDDDDDEESEGNLATRIGGGV